MIRFSQHASSNMCSVVVAPGAKTLLRRKLHHPQHISQCLPGHAGLPVHTVH